MAENLYLLLIVDNEFYRCCIYGKYGAKLSFFSTVFSENIIFSCLFPIFVQKHVDYKEMMKNRIVLTALFVVSALVSGCTSGASKHADNVLPELTEARFDSLVKAIPDHEHTFSPQTTLSEEYYATWREAQAVPEGSFGEIGNGEFLWYFVCGNDPCETHTGTIDSKTICADSAVVRFYINHSNDDTERTLHTMRLKLEHGQWVIADYDGTLAQMKEYVRTQRAYLRSSEFHEEAEAILADPEASDELKQTVRDELEEISSYFRKR